MTQYPAQSRSPDLQQERTRGRGEGLQGEGGVGGEGQARAGHRLPGSSHSGQTQTPALPDKCSHTHVHTCLYMQGTLRHAHTCAHTGDPSAASDPLCPRAPELFLTHPDRPGLLLRMPSPHPLQEAKPWRLALCASAGQDPWVTEGKTHPVLSVPCGGPWQVTGQRQEMSRDRGSEARKGRWCTCSVTSAVPCPKSSS